MMVPEDNDRFERANDDSLAAGRTTKPSPQQVRDDVYDFEERVVEPPRRTINPPPIATAFNASNRRDSPGGLSVPLPFLIGGGICVALVLTGVTWFALGTPGSRGKPPQALTAIDSPTKPPEPTRAPEAPRTRAPEPAVPPLAAASFAESPNKIDPPVAPGEVSVVDAMQTEEITADVSVADVVPAAPPAGKVPIAAVSPAPNATPAIRVGTPEPADDPVLTAQVRTRAAVVNAQDDGAGKILSTADIVAESEPSVALIKGKLSSGTGFLIAPGLLATNSHVIAKELIANLDVRFVSADEPHKMPLKANLLYEDPERDLAFLSVKTDLKPLRIARAYTFRKGEDITVIGNPGMGDDQVLENAISRGVMSTKAQLDHRTFYQLGISVNPGNSGGPVFDSMGRVIGVVTLKAAKQEATSFCIPIEDIHAALTKLSKETAGDADRYRSRHRTNAAVKNLGGGGALMCLIIDLRRTDAQVNNAAVKDALGKLEPMVAEFDQDVSPSLAANAPRIKNDTLLVKAIKSKLLDLNGNFEKIRSIYADRRNVDDNQLRPLKQSHKRLLTELATALDMEIPPGLMVAFDDHSPSQPMTIITMGPQSLGRYGSRLRQRALAPPGAGLPVGTQRPPSALDRMRARGRR